MSRHSEFDQIEFDEGQFDQPDVGGPGDPPVLPPGDGGGGVLDITVNGVSWRDVVLWGEMTFSVRKGLGVAAQIPIDVTELLASEPTPLSRFFLKVPTGEIFALDPVTDPGTDPFGTNGTETVVVHTFECVDPVTALDRKPLPNRVYIDSTAQEILTDLIPALDGSLDVSGITAGNTVPMLDTSKFSKFSDIVRSREISTGDYVVQIDPFSVDGLRVIGDYESNFGASGIAADQTDEEFTPRDNQITPDTDIVNYQKVRGTRPGPDRTVCEFREFDALQSSFQLAAKPFGIEDADLLNVQFGGSVSGFDEDSLPEVIALHYPTVITLSDIQPLGTGTICGFRGKNGATILAFTVSPSALGVIVNGSSAGSVSLPMAAGGAPPDINNQYYYDIRAAFTQSGLTVTVTEHYLNNSGTEPTVTVTEQTIYSGAFSQRFGQPVGVLSGGSGVSLRSWTASYGPPISGLLLANPYTGAPGRTLRIDTLASRTTDIVVQATGNGAVGTFVGENLPLRGDIRIVLNYDAEKIQEAVAENLESQARYGVRAGAIIESEFAVTESECQAIADAVVADRALPGPKGTLIRKSILTTRFPMPPETVAIDLPPEYLIEATTAPITEVSVDFSGVDSITGEGVLNYQITIGNLDLAEIVNRELLAQQISFANGFRPMVVSGPRISGAAWNDVDTVTLSISGGGTITLAGKAASASFDPADYVEGNYREFPVQIAGTISSGGKNHQLLVEIIYPPLPVVPGTVNCRYNAGTNQIVYEWVRPAGALSYKIQRLLDTDNDPQTPPEWREIDEVLTSQYPLAYEPLSKNLKVKVIGLADKESGDFVELVCTLPPLPAPTPFDVVKVLQSGRVVLLAGPPPTGPELTNRAKVLKILTRVTDQATTVADRDDFASDLAGVQIYTFPVADKEASTRYRVDFEDTPDDDRFWVAATYVDGFGDEGEMTAPFDATRPPMTVGSIIQTPADPNVFFRSATQANGGAIEDDNDDTARMELSGVYRYVLGRHNERVQLIMQESTPVTDFSVGTFSATALIHSPTVDVSDQDILNGYVDIPMKQAFRFGKKRHRTYRPFKIIVYGPKVRERIDNSQNAHGAREIKYLVGYTGSPPTIVPNQVDAVFEMTQFHFQPGIAGLTHNVGTVALGTIKPKSDGFVYDWPRLDEPGVNRYFVLIHTAPYGILGPGSDAALATELSQVVGSGQVTVYRQDHSARDVVVQAIDVGGVGKYRFHNGDVIGTLTINAGTTYFVTVLGQKKNGRFSTNFSTVLNTSSGQPISSGGDDADEAVWIDGAGTIITNPVDPVIGTVLVAKKGRIKLKFNRPNGIKSGATTGSPAAPHIIKYGVKIKAGSSNNWLNPDQPGTPITSDASDAAEFFVETNRNSLDVERADLAAVFRNEGLVVALRPYNFVGGAEKKGTITSYTPPAAGVGGDSREEDTAAASAVQGLDLRWSNKKGYKAVWQTPATNNKSIKGYWVVFFNGSVFLNTITGGTLGSEAPAEIFVAGSPATTNLKKAELNSFFIANGLTVKVTPVNVVNGVDTRGTSATFGSIVFPTDNDSPADNTVPSAPGFTWTQIDGKHTFHPEVPSSGATTRLEFQWVLSTSASDPTASGDIEPVEGGSIKKVKKSYGPAVFKLKKVKTSADSAVYQMFCRCRNANISTWSAWTRMQLGQRTNFDRPQTDDIGNAVPTLPTTGILGYQTFSAAGGLGGARILSPMRIYVSDTDVYHIFFDLLDSNQNYNSLRSIFYWAYKKGNAKLKRTGSVAPSSSPHVVIHWTGGGIPVFQCKYQNGYENDVFHPTGYSDASSFVDGADATPLNDADDLDPVGIESTVYNGSQNFPDGGIG